MADHLARSRVIITDLGLSVSSTSETCPDCGATVPTVPGGPIHRHLGASPGCWALYTSLLSREFGAFEARTHQLSVDTYAAQHPGKPSPQSAQSVCTHLVALCLSLEHGLDVEELRPLMGDLSKGRWVEPVWLEPPTAFPLTIVDLLDAGTPAAYGARVHQWAVATWEAWKGRHDQVRTWASSIIADR